ncbi:MAG: enoyl-CoA hydratase [Halobacteriovorax sp.]|nr:enoyl-CoA hydratase [Halobacteriovorax sp.]|tara:strand:+ start:91806 stop:92612 length:807 start_codon:yes stop_codon:yes gene_type:complete
MFSAHNYETILFDINNGVGTITVNREKKLNALNSQVLKEIKDLLETIHEQDKTFSLKGLILTGAGDKAFIAGADISEMNGMTTDEAQAFGKLGQDVSLLFEKLHIPVIAAVNGFALGGGCEMAMSCDFIYATESAVFGQPEVKLGLIPGYGGTQRLARLIGRNRAKEIIYSGRNVKAEEALTLGLAVKLFPNKEAMMEGVEDTFSKILRNSPLAVGASKKVMNLGNDLTVEQGLGCELQQFAEIFSSNDMKEGTAAFMEKRAPEFTGK